MDDPHISELMTKSVATVKEDLSIEELIRSVKERRYSGFPVVDKNGAAVGLVSQNDVLRALAYYQVSNKLPDEEFQEGKRKAAAKLLDADPKTISMSEFLAQPVSSVMTRSLRACRPETQLSKVCAIMADNRIRRVVVLGDHGAVAGIVTATDVVRHFAKAMKRS